MPEEKIKTQVAVLGAGPGGYPAAFHAADLGLEVVLIDREANPGGVCLYRGCIPSKSILHAAGSIVAAKEAEELGIRFGKPDIDLDRLRSWKEGVVNDLTGGLGTLTRKRGIRYVRGRGTFVSSNCIQVRSEDGATVAVEYDHAILATGSVPIRPGFIPESERIMYSTNALDLSYLPERMLVLGGGYIGLELGQAYATLGTSVSVVEMKASLLPGVEPKLVRFLSQRIGKQFESVMLKTRVAAVEDAGSEVKVTFESSDGERFDDSYSCVLVAVGRQPSTEGLGLENTRVETDEKGFIRVGAKRFTTDPSILVIGDIAGHPLLAHKATHEGRIAAEVLHTGKPVYDPRAIPAVVFTDPEIAWCGLTEQEARRAGLDVRVGSFPWAASGRAATLDRKDGLTTIIVERDGERVIGMGIVGYGAGELIAEGVLAIEMGAVAEDLALTIHAHPSLSETVMEAAEGLVAGATHFFQRNA
mgnify:CR=1 FL=1